MLPPMLLQCSPNTKPRQAAAASILGVPTLVFPTIDECILHMRIAHKHMLARPEWKLQPVFAAALARESAEKNSCVSLI